MTTTRKRRGGPPTYTPTVEAARAEGKVTVRLAPQEAAAWREWAEEHGGLVALARHLLARRAEGDLEGQLVRALRDGPVLLTIEADGDVRARLLRVPVPVCGVLAEGAGPGVDEALAGLRYEIERRFPRVCDARKKP